MTRSAAVRGNGATARPEPAQSHTARVVASLERIAELHAELAQVYRELAEEIGDIQLAGPPEPALMAPVDTRAPGPDLLTAEDLSEMLKVSAKTIRRWEAEGLIPRALRLANVLRWDAAIVERWLASEAGR